MPGAPSRPKPFQRPGITLSDGVKREWKSVSVYSLEQGDLVQGAGRGTVTSVSDSPEGVRVFFQNGGSENFSEGESVLAFVKV